MLYPKPQLQELQYNLLIGDASSQAYWWKQYSREVLAVLPGSADDAFGGQRVTQEQLGEKVQQCANSDEQYLFYHETCCG
jgi:hypothetical protein